jgi:hypothetical protein
MGEPRCYPPKWWRRLFGLYCWHSGRMHRCYCSTWSAALPPKWEEQE